MGSEIQNLNPNKEGASIIRTGLGDLAQTTTRLESREGGFYQQSLTQKSTSKASKVVFLRERIC